jgi:tetraacyldisaccharide 4'-kinase
MSRRLTEQVESYVLGVIEGRRRGAGPFAVRVLLRGLSVVFSGLVQARLFFYDQRLLRPHALGCQVISVGNLTVGGTGKTPVVEALARALHASGRKVAILSRGYKKKSIPLGRRLRGRWRALRRDLARLRRGRSFEERRAELRRHDKDRDGTRVVSDGREILLDSALGGDEPYMLATNLPGVAVLVDSDRVRSGRYAVRKLGCDTLILDDGFQYLKLKHRLDFALVDRTNPFGHGRLLPSGLLREPMRNIKRARFIFITKSNGDGAPELRKQLRQLNPTAEISECRHCARHLVDVRTREVRPLSELAGRRVVALSGIASPRGFEQELTHRGAQVLKHVIYADHHRYLDAEIAELMAEARAAGAEAVITTEKDAVRLPPLPPDGPPVHFLRVEIEILTGAEKFNEWIERICFR